MQAYEIGVACRFELNENHNILRGNKFHMELKAMFARISTYKMKPESISAAEAKVKELMPRILGMDGMVTFTNVIDADGNGMVVSIVETKEQSDSNQKQAAAIWAEFSDFLLAPPKVSGYRVIAHESN